MESIKRLKIIKKSLFTLFISASLMFLFEFSKQILFPEITLWLSHIITIVFVSILSFVLSFYLFLSNAYKRMYKKELNIRKINENELLLITKNQERTIEKRTESLVTLNKKLVDSKEIAEESNKLKTVFLQNISHEIRTPLNAIMGFSQLIEHDIDDKDKILSYVEIIIERSNDLLELVDEILTASKLEVGKMPVIIETFSLYDFLKDIKEIIQNVQAKFEKKELEFVFQFVCSEDTFITTDKNKLHFIFSNLIHNAYKFTHKGTIEIGCDKITENEFSFYVSDTGIGIDEENFELIFENFAQISNPVNEFGGFGLGLSIVKGFVELLNGKISVHSAKNRGSIFTFTIPNNVSIL